MPSAKKTSNRVKSSSRSKSKSRSNKSNGLGLGLDMTDVLLIVIVLLVLYFILVDNNRNSDSDRLLDVGVDMDLNIGDTNFGLDTGIELDKDKLTGGIDVNIDNDDARLYGQVDFGDNHKYGAGAYLGVNEDLYGMNLGYNSDKNKPYINLGQINKEGFLDYGPADLTVGNNEIALALFHADWCGHCKRFMPEWQKAKAQLNNTRTKNGKLIKCVDIESKNEEVMKQHGVDSYPTIMIITENSKVVFNGERNVNSLKEFVEENSN